MADELTALTAQAEAARRLREMLERDAEVNAFPEAWQEEGESERLFLGIDGTMGDAQDVPHGFVCSVHGDFCCVCGLGRHANVHRDEGPSRG